MALDLTSFYIGEKMNEQRIEQYEIANKSSYKAVVTNAGAALVSLSYPDNVNVVMKYENMRDYADTPVFSGAVVAPNAGRIPDGRLKIGDNEYFLSENDGTNNTHGGYINLSKIMWNKTSQTDKRVSLEAFLPDGEQGFPGNRRFTAVYTMNESRLILEYTATTDKRTYINMSHHCYFNMSGDFAKSINEHLMQINSHTYVRNKNMVPKETAHTKNTAFDYSILNKIGTIMNAKKDHIQIEENKGYNHCFLIDKTSEGVNEFVKLQDPVSGREIIVYSDASAVHIYSGGYMDGDVILAGNVPASPSCAIAIEPEDVPISISSEEDIKYLSPGEVYKRMIIYSMRHQPL